MTTLLLNIAEITLTVGVIVALLLLLFGMLGKRLTAKCRYIVWALVMLRLCVPVGFSVFSPVFDLTLPEEIVTEWPGETVTEMKNGISEETEKQVDRLPVTPSVDAQGSVTSGADSHIQDGNFSVEPDIFEGEVPLPVIRDEGESDGASVEQTVIYTSKLIETAGTVWLTGAVIFFAIRLGNYLVYSIKLRHSTNLAEPDEETAGIYEKLTSEMGLKRAPVLKVCTEPLSPILFGYFKKIIIIPDMTYDREHIGGILRHELTHYRRGDTWVKLMCCAAEAIHWFNPMVHIAAARCAAEMELSCDEAILRGLEEEERLSYGEAMLQIVRRSMKTRAAGLTTSFNPRRRAVKARFMNIVDDSTKHRGGAVIVTVLTLCIAAGSFFGCTVEGTDVENKTDSWYISNTNYEPLLETDEVILSENTSEVITETIEETFDDELTETEGIMTSGEDTGSDEPEMEPVESGIGELQTEESHEYILTGIIDFGCTEYMTETYRCVICGDEKQVTLSEFGTHSYTITEVIDSTCVQPGKQTAICEKCGNSQTEEYPPIKHDMSVPTCTTPATCKYCGVTVGEPLEHDFAEATFDIPKTCKRCSLTEGEPIPALTVDTETFKKVVPGNLNTIPTDYRLSSFIYPAYVDVETWTYHDEYIISAVEVLDVEYSILGKSDDGKYTVSFDCTVEKLYDMNGDDSVSTIPAYMYAVLMDMDDYSSNTVAIEYSEVKVGDTFEVFFDLELKSGNYKIYFKNGKKPL